MDFKPGVFKIKNGRGLRFQESAALFGLLIILPCLFSETAFAYDWREIAAGIGPVGEVFGNKVSREEFFYYYKTASMFTRGDAKEGQRTDEDIRQEAWQDLILSREARSMGLSVDKKELTEELKRLISEKGIEYGSDKYNVWVLTNLGEDVPTFERRIEDLMLINRLMKMKTEPSVVVTEQEMKDKFLNQYNSFESEYILFGSDKEAKDFAQNCKKNPRLWFDTYLAKKPLGQKGASWINIMSMEALIDLWKIPKDDAYRILDAKAGDFIAAKNYYGDVAFRLLDGRKADLKEYDAKKQEYYRQMMTGSKKYKIAQDYFNDLFKRANYRDYLKEKEDAGKKEEMKTKSQIVMETSQGNIELKLLPDVAPLACENFIGLIEKGYYNGLIFHRVIKDFMIQGGDPTGTGAGGESIWKKPFADEVKEEVKFDRPGILAMANSGADTNGSQFFITTVPTPHLNGRHTIFGEVVSGMDVVKKIESSPADTQDKPKEAQKILKVYIKENKPVQK
jgi:peptidylprolyl isomerase